MMSDEDTVVTKEHSVEQAFQKKEKNWKQQDDWQKNDQRGFKRKFEHSGVHIKKRNMNIGKRLKESNIGITEYVGKHNGFSAIIKERYSDFHVNEIDLDGQVAKLTNQNVPCEPENDETIETLKPLISSEIWDELQVLKEKDFSSVEIDVTNLDKDKRRTIHKIAKKLAHIVSQTVDKDDKKFITIRVLDSRCPMPRCPRIDWQSRGGEYCHFLLHKVNMDTIDALNQLAVSSRIRPDKFCYAGTKDRRAWTTQWVSIRRVDPRYIKRISNKIRGVYVGNFKYARHSLRLGMLRGNQFRIALRNARGTDEEIERAMTSLRDNGFLNYYGLQRFGTIVSIPTYLIGKRLLQGKWREAIDLILKPRPGEQDKELAEARQIYAETKDAAAAYAKITRIDKIEARLLRGLQVSHKNDFFGVLDSVPRNIRLMYVHSYQSYIWNHIVSRRIKEFGTSVIAGDLVYDKQNCQDSDEIAVMMSEITDVNEATDCSTSNNDDKSETDDVMEEKNPDTTNKASEEHARQAFPTVKILTEENLPNYTLADVVMPLPGWKVTYPPYAKAWYNELLAKDKLTTDLRQNNKKYSLTGTYRQILEIPTNLSWKIMHHKEKHDNLISSDLDEIRKRPSPQDEPDGKYKALIIEMCLKSSSYATMALREILKNDTSAETQAALSASHDTENSELTVNTEGERGRDLTDSEADNGKNNVEICEELADVKDEATETDNTDKNNVEICEDLTDVQNDETITANEEESSLKI